MSELDKRAMDGVYPMPIAGREDPPRRAGLTMVIDMGSGIEATRDFIGFAGRYVDILKISSGSAALYPIEVLKEKISILKSAGIEIEAGGSHFEVANWKGKFKEYIEMLIKLKFDYVEIADGHLPLEEGKRLDLIKQAKDMGIKVATEVGKKLPSENIKAGTIIEQAERDFKAGTDYIIIEGKASGMDVGIFNNDGSVNDNELLKITDGMPNMDRVIWEAPLRLQQQALILKFGCNVNLGNIFPQEVYPLELMRNGLMLMPLINAYKESTISGD